MPASLMPLCVCQGICFCAILNNSIFIGPTKTYHPLPTHTPPVCAPSPLPQGTLPSVPFPCPCPQHPSVPPPLPKAHASVMPSLPGERGVELHVPAGDTLGTPLGMGRGEGALLGTHGGVKPKEKSGCAQLWLGHPWLQGGIFVLYFSHVSFPEPGSSVYHPEATIKNKPLAVFFAGLCPECVQSRVRDHLSFCVARAALSCVLQWAAAPRPWGRSGSHTLWLH